MSFPSCSDMTRESAVLPETAAWLMHQHAHEPGRPGAARWLGFLAILEQMGLQAAMAELASMVQRRCTGVFVMHNERSVALACHDQQQAGQGRVDDPGLAGRVHCFVKDAQRGLVKALPAHGLAELPNCNSVPCITAEGLLLGTLACFDLEPQSRPAVDFELLLQVAAAVARQATSLPAHPASAGPAGPTPGPNAGVWSTAA